VPVVPSSPDLLAFLLVAAEAEGRSTQRTIAQIGLGLLFVGYGVFTWLRRRAARARAEDAAGDDR